MNTHLRLNMSPSRPPTSSRLPNDSAYAVTTHCRSPLEKPSACWADGSAMFTIVPSSTSISWATAATTRTSQRRSAGAVRRSRVAEDVVTDAIRVPSYGSILAPSQVKSHHQILVIRAPSSGAARHSLHVSSLDAVAPPDHPVGGDGVKPDGLPAFEESAVEPNSLSLWERAGGEGSAGAEICGCRPQPSPALRAVSSPRGRGDLRTR